MKRVIIDTDGEFDDSNALLLALKSKELRVEAITTLSGIRDMDQVTIDMLNILELLGREDIPLATGMERRFFRDMAPVRERTRKIWENGGRASSKPLRTPRLKPVAMHGVNLLISKIMEAPGEMILVTLGALTNVAMALLKEPRIAKNVKEVYTMGGAIIEHGNSTPVAEFNIWGDPEAAKIFFNSGMPITLVGLGVFWTPYLSAEQWTAFKTANPATKYVYENFEPWVEWLKRRRPELKGGLHVGDALTIGVLIDRSLVETKRIFVDVEVDGTLTSGQTLAYGLYPPYHPPPKEPNTELCVSVDSTRFIDLFMKTVTS